MGKGNILWFEDLTDGYKATLPFSQLGTAATDAILGVRSGSKSLLEQEIWGPRFAHLPEEEAVAARNAYIGLLRDKHRRLYEERQKAAGRSWK